MNSLFKSKSNQLMVTIGVTIVGIAIFEFLDQRRTSKERNLTIGRLTGSRGPSKSLRLPKSSVVQDSLDNSLDTIRTTRSRTSVSLSEGKFRTSSVISKVRNPECKPAKYPPHYYSLSKKAQWKFRKKFNVITH